MRIGVIDLGSNTFHLLIADKDPEHFNIVYRERRYVKLAKGGADRILDDSFERGLICLEDFRRELVKYKAVKVIAIGTSMLRNAVNSQDFIEKAKKQTGIQIQIISGKQEAAYIGRGVMHSLRKYAIQRSIVMDIGGGSCEFIVFDHKKIVFSESYKIGIAFLKQSFNRQDPISADAIKSLRKHLSKTVQPLLAFLAEYPVENLIGCSGSFEVLVEQQGHRLDHICLLDLDETNIFLNQVIQMDAAQRMHHPAIPNERVDLIVCASLLIKWMLDTFPFRQLWYSPFAMKEGIIMQDNE